MLIIVKIPGLESGKLNGGDSLSTLKKFLRLNPSEKISDNFIVDFTSNRFIKGLTKNSKFVAAKLINEDTRLEEKIDDKFKTLEEYIVSAIEKRDSQPSTYRSDSLHLDDARMHGIWLYFSPNKKFEKEYNKRCELAMAAIENKKPDQALVENTSATVSPEAELLETSKGNDLYADIFQFVTASSITYKEIKILEKKLLENKIVYDCEQKLENKTLFELAFDKSITVTPNKYWIMVFNALLKNLKFNDNYKLSWSEIEYMIRQTKNELEADNPVNKRIENALHILGVIKTNTDYFFNLNIDKELEKFSTSPEYLAMLDKSFTGLIRTHLPAVFLELQSTIDLEKLDKILSLYPKQVSTYIEKEPFLSPIYYLLKNLEHSQSEENYKNVYRAIFKCLDVCNKISSEFIEKNILKPLDRKVWVPSMALEYKFFPVLQIINGKTNNLYKEQIDNFIYAKAKKDPRVKQYLTRYDQKTVQRRKTKTTSVQNDGRVAQSQAPKNNYPATTNTQQPSPQKVISDNSVSLASKPLQKTKEKPNYFDWQDAFFVALFTTGLGLVAGLLLFSMVTLPWQPSLVLIGICTACGLGLGLIVDGICAIDNLLKYLDYQNSSQEIKAKETKDPNPPETNVKQVNAKPILSRPGLANNKDDYPNAKQKDLSTAGSAPKNDNQL